MTHAQSETSSNSVTNTSSAAGALERELAAEQAHVDRVYARLAEATRSAQRVAREGFSLYQSDRNSYVREEDGTGLFERDVFAYQAARRLAVLDAEQEGLVFGRLDRTDGEIRYVGRIGVRDADYEPLVIDSALSPGRSRLITCTSTRTIRTRPCWRTSRRGCPTSHPAG